MKKREREMEKAATHTKDDNDNNNNNESVGAASKGVFECTPPLQCIYGMDTIKMQELKHFRQYGIKFSMSERMYE